MRLRLVCIAATLLASILAAPAAAQVTDEQIDQAIARGAEWLLKHQNAKGEWDWRNPSRPPDPKISAEDFDWPFSGGWQCMAMLGLIYADTDLKLPGMRLGLEQLLKLPLTKTYTASVRIIALAKLMPRLNRAQAAAVRAVIARDVAFLEKTQQAAGAWSYPAGPDETDMRRWDFSNTQFAVLALAEAARVRAVEISADVMKKSLDLYLAEQRDDGGWTYWHSRGVDDPRVKGHADPCSYGSMTAAGVASLYLFRDQLMPYHGCPCGRGQSTRAMAQVTQGIDRGLAWLDARFSPARHPAIADTGFTDFKWGDQSLLLYWLFSVERAGLASGIKYLGRQDWYATGAEFLLSEQEADGGWRSIIRTSWAIVFLAKGRAPILVNKVRFEGLWNQHPSDAANLARAVGERKEQPMRWQVITLDAPEAEWHDAAMLYISAESPLALTDEHKKKLRAYTDNGGTILFEATCGNPKVDRAWRATCRELWPEFELRPLTDDHPLWTADEKIAGQRATLEGIADGVRTFLFYAPKDLSCAWQTLAVKNQLNAFLLGVNLYAYATDRGALRGPLQKVRFVDREPYPSAKLAAGPQVGLAVRLLKHGGDWNVTAHYAPLRELDAHLGERSPVRLRLMEPASAADLAGADVLWLTGRKGVSLSDAEAASLGNWLAGGGWLIADAAMGDAEFDAAFRKLAEQMHLTLKPLAADDPLITGKMDPAAGHDLTHCRYSFAIAPERVGVNAADPVGLYLGDRLVGVYSPLDVLLSSAGVKAFGTRGYAPPDARALAVNAILAATRSLAAGAAAP